MKLFIRDLLNEEEFVIEEVNIIPQKEMILSYNFKEYYVKTICINYEPDYCIVNVDRILEACKDQSDN